MGHRRLLRGPGDAARPRPGGAGRDAGARAPCWRCSWSSSPASPRRRRRRWPGPPPRGTSGLVGLGGLFLALSRGTMGLVAPLTAVIAAAVPALVGVATGDQLDTAAMLGMLLALAAVVAVAMPDWRWRGSAGAEPVTGAAGASAWGLVAVRWPRVRGVLPGRRPGAPLGAGPWWTLATSRTASLCIIAVLARRAGAARPGAIRATARARCCRCWRYPRSATRVATCSSCCRGPRPRSPISVVLSSLYPVSTAILARVVLHERLSRLALVGVVLGGLRRGAHRYRRDARVNDRRGPSGTLAGARASRS